jgi:hypothetical protein
MDGFFSRDIIIDSDKSWSSTIFDNDLRVLVFIFASFIFDILLLADLIDFDFADFDFADVMVFREFGIFERDFTEFRGIVERLRLYRTI